MSQRFEGKNIEEALGHASEAFGVERYRLTYHVVVEKRGFLGGVKRVVIEAEVNEAATEPPPQQPVVEMRSGPPSSAPRSWRRPWGLGWWQRWEWRRWWPTPQRASR